MIIILVPAFIGCMVAIYYLLSSMMNDVSDAMLKGEGPLTSLADAPYIGAIMGLPDYVPPVDDLVNEALSGLKPSDVNVEIRRVVTAWIKDNSPRGREDVMMAAKESGRYKYEYEKAKALITQGKVDVTPIANGIRAMSFYLPSLLAPNSNGEPLREFVIGHGHITGIPESLKQSLLNIKVAIQLPKDLRTEHMQILANPGHGKSTLLTQMFFEDLKTDAGIVVIDSQGDLINELAKRVPADRLILVDPETCPPALNMFARKVEGEQGITNALALFEYIFGSLGVSLTGKQEMVYRYLSRLCMIVPGGSINMLRDMLLPRGTEQHQAYINQMGDNAQAFFRQFQQEKNNQYSDTRQEVLTKLLKVLESDTFSAMLGANTMALDIPQALSEGKVILVSTAKNFLDKGASLLGRIFVAQVMQAVRNRKPGDRRRVYLYIDEFADYAEDSSILLDCFSQGRKYELGMIVAHQNLGQLTPKLADTMSSSTAIKFAGGVSAEDSRKLASQMRTDYHLIDAQSKGTFLGYFKDIGVLPWKVQLGFIDTVPVITDLHSVQADMRARYGAKRRTTSLDPEPPRPREDDFQDDQENWGD
jgi:hypothetical protein